MRFQDASSSIIENMIIFYDYAIIVVVIIIVLILYILIFIVKNKFIHRYLLDGQIIELVWTIVPMFFLIFLAFPSLKVLYLRDEINNPIYSFKAIGHQWYWEYEYNLNLINFNLNLRFENVDSVILTGDNVKLNSFRLLDVSNNFYIPLKTQVRVLVLSDDVIHSFAIPALGVKVDAVPGRLNQVGIYINRPGLYFGQCSEICGVNHRFIPIVVESFEVKSLLDHSILVSR